MVSPRTVASPSTLTKTRAWRRSGLVSTAVTVTKPTRGSLRSCVRASLSTSRMASFTRRMRSLMLSRDERAAHLHRELALDLSRLVDLQDVALLDVLEVV